MTVFHAPTGKVIKGHLFDVSLTGFTRALKDLDKQLYVVWNPNKLKGWGCWEIRRLPNRKTATFQGEYKGVSYYKLEHVEIDVVHHVIDAAFLNYDVIRKLKEMDAWGHSDWTSDFESKEDEMRDSMEQKARDELKYALKQNKSVARDFYEAVRSGVDPAQIITSISWAQNK